jgi:hypothetical protein
LPFLSVVFLLVKGNFQVPEAIAEGVSHLNLALSKGKQLEGAVFPRAVHRKHFLADESRV